MQTAVMSGLIQTDFEKSFIFEIATGNCFLIKWLSVTYRNHLKVDIDIIEVYVNY